MMDRGDAAIDAIIPVPNTTDALGVLKGEVDLTPSYKRLGECGEPELQMVRDFLANYAGILSWEAEAVRKHVEGLP
jgi:hypothetical protein